MRKLVMPAVILLAAPALAAWLAAPEAEPTLLGMWSQTTPSNEGDPVRFYYFHDGGIGLFRYGKMGLTQTRSFRYSVQEDRLQMVFIRSGASHSVPFTLVDGALELAEDPMLGGKQAYRRKGSGGGHGAAASKHPLARMWKHVETDQMGQETFHMYQLQAPALDGRGVGWYHVGDYSDWSTEALTYRRTGDTLVLEFTLRGERARTKVEIEGHHHRALVLEQDPRNFWHARRYRDDGPGFSVTLDGEPMPYAVRGHGGASDAPEECPHAR